ncbi:MAG TPA: phosphate acyltransferase, partial [Vicinamibacterales bacterium]|nr:phosphate acyltransferase [Vicinamibacterales bacterium]
MTFLGRVYERARAMQRRVVLPEGGDARVREAGLRIEREGLATVDVLEPGTPHAARDTLVSYLRSRRPDRFPTDVAAIQALEHPLTFGASLVGAGAADVMVGGAAYPTGDTIRAALWAVGCAPGITTVSGAFYMMKGDMVLTFSDCAVVPEPTPEQLADIAVAAARDRRRLVEDEPVVALLSYSTKGSAAGPRVERVQRAVEVLRGRNPNFVFDGELQGDAALALDVAARKAPGSPA